MTGKELAHIKRYSTMLTEVECDQYKLEIRGRRFYIALTLGILLSSQFYLLLQQDQPLLLKILLSTTSFLTSYGLFEVLFSKCFLHLNLGTNYLCVQRGNPFGYTSFEGKVSQVELKIGKKLVRWGAGLVKHYQVIISVGLKDAYVEFLLEPRSYTESEIPRRIEYWSGLINK